MKTITRLFLIIFLISIAFLAVYFLFLRELISLSYEGQSPVWFSNLISFFYPRFEVEKHRFPLEFFLNKGDQVAFRILIINTLLFTGITLFNKSIQFKNTIQNLFNHQTSIQNVSILRILYFLLLILIFHDIYLDLMRLHQIEVFYKPITLYRILYIPFPNEFLIIVICILFFTACITSILNILPVISSSVAVLFFILIQGWIFSFEKFDHGFATFTYAGILLPFLLAERKNQNSGFQNGWALSLIKTSICLSYFYTGMEKVLISQTNWINGNSLTSHLLNHGVSEGIWLANQPLLVIVISNLTLLVQLGFIFILFYDKLKYFFIPAGFLFHISVGYFMGIGGILNPWILVYIFFFDWSWLYQKFKKILEFSLIYFTYNSFHQNPVADLTPQTVPFTAPGMIQFKQAL